MNATSKTHPSEFIHRPSDEVLVKVDHVSKKFCKSLKRSLWYGVHDILSEFTGKNRQQDLRKNEFWAIKDISFELKRGECLGLIGPNGAGKSTLLKMLNGLIKPDQGRIEMYGRIGAMIELGAGFNPILTGRENIYNKGAMLGFSQKEIDRKFDAIVDFAEIGDFLDMPVQNYSSGMKVRLGFAVSAQMDPDVLVIDEVLAVGDMGFVIKCLNRMSEIICGSAVIFVSHSMPMVSLVCNRLMLMNNGTVEYHGSDTALGIGQYLKHFSAPQKMMSGTGQARINSIELFNDTGDEITHLQSGEACVLKISVSVDEGIEDAALSVYIYNQELRPVANLRGEQNGFIPLHSKKGKDTLCSIEIPKMNLKMGNHSITVIVSGINEMECLVRVDNALTLDVYSDHMNWADTVWPCTVTLISKDREVKSPGICGDKK